MKITNDTPAFPTPYTNALGEIHSQNGLTIRQQFAMSFMQGMLSSDKSFEALDLTAYAKASVELADVLIMELNK